MYKNILVPIDPSHIDEAAKTLELAEHLKSDDGKITLFSVIEDIPAYVAAQMPDFSLESSRESAVKGLERLAKAHHSKAVVYARIGHAARTIQEFQKKNNCDLIIVSSHKPTAVDYFLGSTASKVVQRAQCPVFVLR